MTTITIVQLCLFTEIIRRTFQMENVRLHSDSSFLELLSTFVTDRMIYTHEDINNIRNNNAPTIVTYQSTYENVSTMVG